SQAQLSDELEEQAPGRPLRPAPRLAGRLLEGDGGPAAAGLGRGRRPDALVRPEPRSPPADRAGVRAARLGPGADESTPVRAGEPAEAIWCGTMNRHRPPRPAMRSNAPSARSPL